MYRLTIQKKQIFNQFSQLITDISSRSNRNLGKRVNKAKNCSHALEDVILAYKDEALERAVGCDWINKHFLTFLDRE